MPNNHELCFPKACQKKQELLTKASDYQEAEAK